MQEALQMAFKKRGLNINNKTFNFLYFIINLIVLKLKIKKKIFLKI